MKRLLSDDMYDIQPSFRIDYVYKNPDNASTGEKEDLPGNMNIEIHHTDHTAECLIYFGGFRFSDNRYIIGVTDTGNDNDLRITDTPDPAYTELVIY